MALAIRAQISTVNRQRTVAVRAQAQQPVEAPVAVPRRAALGLAAATVFGAVLVAAERAEAITIPSQASTGGLGVGGGSIPASATKASSSSYVMEGTRKQGVTPKRKAKLLAKVKEEAKKSGKPAKAG